jgi:hypothetical protein
MPDDGLLEGDELPPTIFELMPRVAGEIGAVGEGGVNKQQGYRFRSIKDMMTAASSALAKHGVFVCPQVEDLDVDERTTEKGTVLRFVVLRVRYIFYGPRGDSIDCVAVGEAMDSGDKASNKAMSAAFKYALGQTFCIPYTAEEDADATTHEPIRARQAPPREAQDGKPTPKQKAFVRKLLGDHGGEWPIEVLEYFSGNVPHEDEWSKTQMSWVIDKMKSTPPPPKAQRRRPSVSDPEEAPF